MEKDASPSCSVLFSSACHKSIYNCFLAFGIAVIAFTGPANAHDTDGQFLGSRQQSGRQSSLSGQVHHLAESLKDEAAAAIEINDESRAVPFHASLGTRRTRQNQFHLEFKRGNHGEYGATPPESNLQLSDNKASPASESLRQELKEAHGSQKGAAPCDGVDTKDASAMNRCFNHAAGLQSEMLAKIDELGQTELCRCQCDTNLQKFYEDAKKNWANFGKYLTPARQGQQAEFDRNPGKLAVFVRHLDDIKRKITEVNSLVIVGMKLADTGNDQWVTISDQSYGYKFDEGKVPTDKFKPIRMHYDMDDLSLPRGQTIPEDFKVKLANTIEHVKTWFRKTMSVVPVHGTLQLWDAKCLKKRCNEDGAACECIKCDKEYIIISPQGGC
eukprot:gnl/MRDRNA2_/MRDRNA2_81161_c0_seq1.p1 gnl/MRDRNA2_/MRDRNA2_81161_c0~~gnl/MRDRNA2_/MRDRNA2_81161_c0_seq1.p1  ORF type:complete len:386 (+),score=46.32 gnl/MRDRNA2_/MRDRNA2_81161_c0_seq1:139-1296(+)